MVFVSRFPTKGWMSMHQSPSINAVPGFFSAMCFPVTVFPTPIGPFMMITLISNTRLKRKIKSCFCKTCSSQAFHMIPQQSKNNNPFSFPKRQKARSRSSGKSGSTACLGESNHSAGRPLHLVLPSCRIYLLEYVCRIFCRSLHHLLIQVRVNRKPYIFGEF